MVAKSASLGPRNELPWLKPLLVGIYVGESNHSVGFLRCEMDGFIPIN